MKIAAPVACFFGLSVLALVACGSSTTETPPAPVNDGGPESGIPAGDAGMTATEAGADGGTGPIDISSWAQDTWKWVPVAGATCRDGSATGIGINLGSKTDKLMVYFEGGGACFNSLTCGPLGGNPSKFGATDFATRFGSATALEASVGVFDRTDPANPVKDWNFVYVPYCTGDVHAGNATNATVPGIATKQQFVGYVNVALDLQRVVPTFPGLTQVLDTGISAGGFGAATNYVQLAKAFSPVPVYELDDSGPAMEDPYLPKCLQSEQEMLWGFENTILKECGTDCPDHSNYSIALSQHVVRAYPNVPFGLIESTEDGTISQFFGFGLNNCAQLNATSLPPAVPGTTFKAGLTDLRSQMKGFSNYGSFIFAGNQHTSIGATMTLDNGITGVTDTLLNPPANGAGDGGGSSTEGGATEGGAAEGGAAAEGGTTAEGGSAADGGATIRLTDWIAALLAGKVTNVGP